MGIVADLCPHLALPQKRGAFLSLARSTNEVGVGLTDIQRNGRLLYPPLTGQCEYWVGVNAANLVRLNFQLMNSGWMHYIWPRQLGCRPIFATVPS